MSTGDGILGNNMFAYCGNNPVNYSDPTGHLPEWAMWTIGGVLLVASIAVTICTAGAASGTIAATAHVLASGAMISGLTSATIGTVAGGLSYQNGQATWSWSGAAEGFMWGSITGVASGIAGSALSSVGNGLAKMGTLGKLGYAGIQGLINSGIAAGLTSAQGLLTNSFSWDGVLLSSAFGFAGGTIGISEKWGTGFRSVLVGIGLSISESTVGEFIEWFESRAQASMSYMRLAYCP